MAALAPSSLADRLRQRAAALPLDRAPLRRAGLLTVLLVALLGLGKMFSPTPAPSTDRQDLRSETEEVSAPRSSTAWTGGRVLAVLFLVTGGGFAFWLHRRAGGRTAAHGSTIHVLETHPLGPGQSLRLVACGEEVLLLSVASEGATLLRHWPRATFDAEPVSFASALASLTTPEAKPLASPPSSHPDAEHGTDERATDPPPPTSSIPSAGPAEASMRHTSDGACVATVELATAEAPPTTARGTLFPPRGHAPRQFDVRHG